LRIIFIGDVIGRDARDALAAVLPDLKQRYKPSAVIVNGENAAHGFGITAQICDDFFKVGVDCITTGNHVWDQREVIPFIEREPRLLRPLNFPDGTPGRGSYIVETPRGEKILVANIMGRLFMDALDDPFAAADKLLKTYQIGRNVNAIFIDFHAEASSEKFSMGHFCDGRASVVVGTHTHVPTADAQVLPKGTGYQTDAGMTASYDSVIGMDAGIAVARFVRKMPGEKLRPAEGPVTVCGVMADIDPATGLCLRMQPIRIGGRLSPAQPQE
jgi:metallophosphoesterase (TIGR00282 family)